MVAAEPLAAPVVERAGQDMAPGLLAQPDQEADVVQRDQPEPQHVLDHEQMAQVAARVGAAGLAVAFRIERRLVGLGGGR